MRDIGKNIRSLRQRQGISQDQLAQILHVTRQTISNYETGRSRPDVEMLTALADALGADVTDVLYGPAGQEPRTKQLRQLAIVAGITALLGIAYWRGALWAQDLMRSFYHMGPSIVLRILIQPLLCGLLTWVIIRTCMIATRARRPQALWATWIRWGAVVVAVFYLLSMLPLSIRLIQWTRVFLEHLANQTTAPNFSFTFGPPASWFITHITLLPWIGIVSGGIWGALGFPGRRTPTPSKADAPQPEQPDRS